MNPFPKVIPVILLFLLPVIPLYSQSQEDKQLAQQFIEMADEIMKNTRAEIEARDNYEQAAKLDPTNIRANYMAGRYRIITSKRGLAAPFFEQVKKLDPNYRFEVDYMIGHAYHYQHEFDRAIEHYNLYKQRLEAQPDYQGEGFIPLSEVERRIEECNNGKELIKNPVNLTITNLGPSINSEFDDFAPVFNDDESLIIFTSRRREDNLNEDVDKDNMPFEDIYYAYYVDGNWDKAINIGNNINTPFHDSNLAMSHDGKQLYIYKEVGNGDIYVSLQNEKDGLWYDPEPVGHNINTPEFTENSLTLSDDGNLMIFASNRFGGYGDFDLYYTTLDAGGNWSAPTNMGGIINTRYLEDGPYLDHDGKTLFFSSEGHNTMGGYDIFRTVYDSASNQWSKPENVGYPINTADNDIFYITASSSDDIFFSSIREDGYGFLDIYKLSPPSEDTEEPVEPVEEEKDLFPVKVVVTIIDGKTGDPLDANVTLKKADDKSVVELVKEGVGVYTTSLENEQAENYVLSSDYDGYIFETRALRIPGMKDEDYAYERNISMQKIAVNVTRVLRNIYFEFDKAVFLSESMEELNKLLKMMTDNPAVKVEIGGHTDNVGDAGYNKQLSQNRADAVRSYLIENGIDAGRVTAVGYGEERPLASNDDEQEGRELNRRVEFTVKEN